MSFPNSDTITDFEAADTLVLDGTIFAALGPTVTASELRVGNLFTNPSQKLIYNPTTGALAYDADGEGGPIGVVTFAFLDPGLTFIDASSFTILT